MINVNVKDELLTITLMLLLLSKAHANPAFQEFHNDHDGRIEVVVTDEKSDDTMFKFPLDAGHSYRISLDKVFKSNTKNILIVGKGLIPTPTSANKCPVIPIDQNYKIVFSTGPLKTVNCGASPTAG